MPAGSYERDSDGRVVDIQVQVCLGNKGSVIEPTTDIDQPDMTVWVFLTWKSLSTTSTTPEVAQQPKSSRKKRKVCEAKSRKCQRNQARCLPRRLEQRHDSQNCHSTTKFTRMGAPSRRMLGTWATLWPPGPALCRTRSMHQSWHPKDKDDSERGLVATGPQDLGGTR